MACHVFFFTLTDTILCDKKIRFQFWEGSYHKTLAHLHGLTGKLNTQDLKYLYNFYFYLFTPFSAAFFVVIFPFPDIPVKSRFQGFPKIFLPFLTPAAITSIREVNDTHNFRQIWE